MKVFNRNYPVCSNGMHNHKTKHKESDCREFKKGEKRKTKANNVRAPRDDHSNDSRSSLGAFICIGSALSIKAVAREAILDSGASHHMFSSRDNFVDYRKRTSQVQIANGNSLRVEGDGFVQLNTLDGKSIKLKALHVPSLQGTLISLGRLLFLKPA